MFHFCLKHGGGSSSKRFCALEPEASDSENSIWREEVLGGASIVPRVMAGKSRDVWTEEGDDNGKRYQDVWQ